MGAPTEEDLRSRRGRVDWAWAGAAAAASGVVVDMMERERGEGGRAVSWRKSSTGKRKED